MKGRGPVKIAVCQFAAGVDSEANLRACAGLIDQAAAAGADLAVLPELAMYFDPRHTGGRGPHGQPLDGPFATAIGRTAASAGITVIVGTLEIAADAPDSDPRDYNTLLAVGAHGETMASYRKIHLYDAFGFRESDVYRPGPIVAPVTVDVSGVRVGVLTCYDLRFPEPFRWVVDAGADVVAVPSAWIAGPAKERHWATLLAARAIENTVYLAGAGQTGPVCCGDSMVIDPTGAVVAGAGAEPGLALADVDLDLIATTRRTNPSLANRRFTVAPLRAPR